MEHLTIEDSRATLVAPPPELRLQILNVLLSEISESIEPAIVIRSDGVLQRMRYTKEGLTRRNLRPLRPILALTQVSRLLRTEATPLLYSRLHFKVFSYCDEGMKLGAKYRHACTLEPGDFFFKHVKHVYLLISIFSRSCITAALQWLTLFADYLDAGQAELENLSVKFRTYIHFNPSRANSVRGRLDRKAAEEAKRETFAMIDEAKVAERLEGSARVLQMLDIAQVDDGL